MKWLRSVFLMITTMTLVPILLCIVIIHGVNHTALDPQKLKVYLQDTEFYHLIKLDLIDMLMDKTFSNSNGRIDRLLGRIMEDTADQLVSDEWLQHQMEKALDTFWVTLRKEQEIRLIFDLAEWKARFLQVVDKQWDQYLSFSSLPLNLSKAIVKERLNDKIPESLDLTTLVLEENEVEAIKTAYYRYRLVLPVLYSLAVILSGAVLLFAWSYVRGARWLAINFLMAATLIWLLYCTQNQWRENIVHIELASNDRDYQPVFESLMRHSISDMGIFLFIGSGIFVAIGVLCIAVSIRARRRVNGG